MAGYLSTAMRIGQTGAFAAKTCKNDKKVEMLLTLCELCDGFHK
jgi:hypothetical protein